MGEFHIKWTDSLSLMSPPLLPNIIGLRDHVEDCIVYHELAITAYDIARVRVLGHQCSDHEFFVTTAIYIARENAQIDRLRQVLRTLS